MDRPNQSHEEDTLEQLSTLTRLLADAVMKLTAQMSAMKVVLQVMDPKFFELLEKQTAIADQSNREIEAAMTKLEHLERSASKKIH